MILERSIENFGSAAMAVKIDFDELRKVDERSQLVVFGYIRNVEIEFDSNSSNPIPPLISYICLMYFYVIEYFEFIGNHIKLSENKSTISKTDNGWTSTSYGSVITPSTDPLTAKWFIKLINPKNANIIIGIQSSNIDINQPFTWNRTGDMYYGFYLATGTKHQNKSDYRIRSCIYVKTTQLYKKDDIIIMELNMDQRYIRFYHNDQDLGIAFRDIEQNQDLDYRLCVALYGKDVVIKINKIDII